MSRQAGHVIAVHEAGSAGFIHPGTPAWQKMITPSKAAAILGESRWESQYSLWNRMKGYLPDEEPNDRFDAGHDAEFYGAVRWQRLNPGWDVSRGEVQFVVDPEHFGFPCVATLDRRASKGSARRVLEVKTANDLYEWGDPKLEGNLGADYTTQQFAQMAMTGWTKWPASLMVLGPRWGFERDYKTAFDPEVWAWMLTEIRTFWDTLAGVAPPPLDDNPATYQCIRELHPDIEPDTKVKVSREEAVSFLRGMVAEDEGKKSATGAKSWVLNEMKSAQYAVVDAPGGKELTVATRYDNGKGSVSLRSAKKSLADIEQMEGN